MYFSHDLACFVVYLIQSSFNKKELCFSKKVFALAFNKAKHRSIQLSAYWLMRFWLLLLLFYLGRLSFG